MVDAILFSIILIMQLMIWLLWFGLRKARLRIEQTEQNIVDLQNQLLDHEQSHV